MSLTPEGKVKSAIKAYLKAEGIWYFMPAANGMGRAGIPDFICCVDGWFLGIESKAPGRLSALTPGQAREIEAIQTHGGTAIAVDSVDKLREIVDDIRRRRTPDRGNGSADESSAQAGGSRATSSVS